MNAAEELTEPDRMIAYALQANGRATWGAIARALGLSERTVQRRGQRLLDSGLVQVSTYLDTTIVGEAHPLVLRLSTRTGAALQVGEELARRPDASSVSVVEGSGDVVCMLLPRTRQDSSRLLLAELPAIDGVVSVEASTVLRYFRSGYDWSVGDLPEPVVETLRAETPTRAATASGPVQLTREDESLVAALAEDGRATVISLAKAADISAPTARRRLEALFGAGALHVRTELSSAVHDLRVEAMIWLNVPPDHVESVGAALGCRREVRFCVACTGSSQILVDCLVPDPGALYSFLTGAIGSLGSVSVARSSVVLEALRRGPMQMANMRYE